MPVFYDSIVDEHNATREKATLFDVSHMGRFRFDGEHAAQFLDQLTTRRVTNIKPGQIRYSLMTNGQGGILDDILIYHLNETDGTPSFGLVVNAGNRDKIAAWIATHGDASLNVSFSDHTSDTGMIAVQGPLAVGLVNGLVDFPLDELKYYTGIHGKFDGIPVFVSRTGYTGEDGCEITVAASDAENVWQRLLDQGAEDGVRAAGLGARDTLRLEAAMPLYGHELTEDIDPFQAGLGFAVHLKDREFSGKPALQERKAAYAENGPSPQRVGLQLAGRRPPREGYPVLLGDQTVGIVTSGAMSPTLGYPIAMAMVTPNAAEIGSTLAVDIRGKQHSATVVELPFYRRT